MSSDTRKSFRINIFCSILVVAFLVCVPVISAWTSVGAGRVGATDASTKIQADPLHRLPSSPEEAHKRVQKREVGWPDEPVVDGARSSDSVQSGVRVSIPYDTVSGRTSHNSSAVRIELIRASVTIQTVNRTTDSHGVFTADLSTGDIRTGDTVRVTDLVSGSPVNINCTLTGSINTSTDVVHGTAASGTAVNVYICTPSTILGDVPPGSAHKTSTGPNWSTNFASTLNLRTGDTAFFYATDGNSNVVMNVADTGGSLVVYPQYDDVLGFYQASTLLKVHAGSASMNVGTAKDGFFEAWFTSQTFVPGEKVSCNMATNRSVTLAEITAKCDPATNRVSGNGPANRTIRVTMNPYGGSPAVYQSSTNAQGNFNVALGTKYTATGSDVYNVAWYDSDGDAVVYEFQTISWYFAEGTCRPGFDPYLTIQNPGAADAAVKITYMKGDSTTQTQTLTVAAHARATVGVKGILGEGNDAAHDFSSKVECTNGQQIIAERPMYFNYRPGQLNWNGGSDVVGALSPASVFYFAEGTARPGFDPYLTIQNPGAADAAVKITYMKGDSTTQIQTLTVPALSRSTVVVKDALGEGNDAAHDFSSKVECTNGHQIIVERPMYFNYRPGVLNWNGGSDVVGALSPASVFYFAEGTARPGFDPYFTIQNPGASNAAVKITYMKGDSTTQVQFRTVPAHSRSTVVVKDALGEGNDAAHDFSSKVECTNGQSIIAERPMYFNYRPGQLNWNGGSDVVGALAPASVFYFAEGTARPGFDPYFTIQNPGAADAAVKITYMKGDSTTQVQTLTVPAHSRSTVVVKDALGTGNTAAYDFSSKVECTNGQSIIAERPMYFNYRPGVLNWNGGSDVVGYTP